MFFEERPAHVLVERNGEIVVQVEDSLDHVVGGHGVLHSHTEQDLEPLQRVLIHGINDGQVDYAEEEEGGAVGHRAETFSSHIDFFLSNFRFLHSDVNLF